MPRLPRRFFLEPLEERRLLASDLSIVKTGPTGNVAAGSNVTYTIVVRNTGPDVATASVADVVLSANISSDTFTSTATGGATGNTAAGTGNVADAVTLPVGSTITYIVQGTVSGSATGSLSNTATVTPTGTTTDANTANNTSVATNPLVPATVDLSIIKTDGVSSVAAGSVNTYSIIVTNTGPSAVTGATVSDTISATLSGATFTAVGTGGASGFANGSGDISQVVNLPVGSTITYTVTGSVSASASGSISNSATVTTPAGVTEINTANNTSIDTDTVAATPTTADLAITKSNGTTTVSPGGAVTYVIVVSNNGPSAVTGANVTDTFSASLTGVAFTATSTGGASGAASGSGSINQTVNLPVGSTITYTVTGTASASASGSITNTARVTAPAGVAEVTASNNIAVDADLVVAAAVPPLPVDLAITKTNGTATVAAGGAVSYIIVVSNNGPTAVTGATVTDAFAASLTSPTFTVATTGGASGAASGSGNINQVVNLPVGSTITYTVTGTLSASATGSLTNTAFVSTPAGVADVNVGNNVAVDADLIAATTATADLSITKTDAVGTVTPGGTVTYTIVVSNAGQTAVTGATVTDIVPSALTNVSFTATPAGGATGAASGTGNINQTVNLPVGSSVTYAVTGTVAASATGSIANTATVTTPAGVADATVANNTAIDVDVVLVNANLGVTKTDNITSVAAGGSVTYTIVVTNAGPNAVTGATVSDTFSASLTGVTFTAVGAGGASGFASGSGVINQTVNLPVGATITYTVTGLVSPTATGTLTNSVTVTPPAGVTDATLTNNTAIDTDTITTGGATTDLSVTKSADVDTVAAGDQVTFTVTVTNTGAVAASNIVLTDAIPAGTTFVSAEQTSGAAFTLTPPPVGGTGTITASAVTLAPGETVTFTYVVQTDSGLADGDTISNTVTVTSSTAETTLVNNTDTITVDIGAEVSLECVVETLNFPGDPGTVILEDDADNPGAGALIITGRSRNDAILVVPLSNNRLRVLLNGRAIGTFNRADVQHIVVFAGSGNDLVDILVPIDATLFGEAGNDQLFGNGGEDGIDGGTGNDRIFGRGGDDTLCGDNGNDHIDGMAGNDHLGGDNGNDKLIGGAGADLIVGGNGNDFLAGGSGNDFLFGQAGNDRLFGDSGNDMLVGGDGNDRLFGGPGRDVLIGGDGNDQLNGESGDDILFGGSTAVDEDLDALQAIIDEWSSSDDFDTRIDNLIFGGLDESSLFDDGRNDTLIGSSGRDWFLVASRDRVRDRTRSDRVN